MGRAANSIGVALAGLSSGGTDGGQVHGPHEKPPSQTWRTFLANHVPDIAACDFFTVPTVTFRVLYVFIVLRHDRRQVVHFHVTDHSYAEWAAQQIIDAFPYEAAPRFLLRDRDGIYGHYFPIARQEHGDRGNLDCPTLTVAKCYL